MLQSQLIYAIQQFLKFAFKNQNIKLQEDLFGSLFKRTITQPTPLQVPHPFLTPITQEQKEILQAAASQRIS